MQAPFSCLPDTLAAIEASISPVRLARYAVPSGEGRQSALRLYQWNALVSQSLYWPLQTLEVVSRNSISRVLSESFSWDWHFDPRFQASLSIKDKSRLGDAIDRQRRERLTPYPSTDPVIADLSFGFWVSLLSRRYDIPIGWTRRLGLAFPHLPDGYEREAVYRRMNDMRILRNRIAHHQPIFQLPLEARYDDLLDLIGWVSPETRWFITATCTFRQSLASRPDPARFSLS